MGMNDELGMMNVGLGKGSCVPLGHREGEEGMDLEKLIKQQNMVIDQLQRGILNGIPDSDYMPRMVDQLNCAVESRLKLQMIQREESRKESDCRA